MFASHLSSQLTLLGCEVIMVCLFDGSAQLPFTGRVVNLRRPATRRLFDYEGWKELAKIVDEFRPDLVQANAGDTLKFAVFSRIFFSWKAPIIFRNANKVSDFIDSRIKLAVNKFLVRRVEHIISVSELCRLDFVSTYNVEATRTTTIPIGIELTEISGEISNDLHFIFNGKKVVLCVGSLVPEKNHIALIRMARQLNADDIRFVIIGDGRLRQDLQQQIEENNLSGKVLLAGYREDVLSLMRNASVLAMPSLIEGLPGVILEAFYCKLPVVANDVGGISEVVIPGKTGWLVRKHDEQGFCQSLVQALDNKVQADGIRENAFDLAVASFSNSMIAQRFLEVYKKLIPA